MLQVKVLSLSQYNIFQHVKNYPDVIMNYATINVLLNGEQFVVQKSEATSSAVN